jgi:hypothetical protein
MRLSIDQPYYVYGLADPFSKEIRYVGVTYRPSRRLKDHLYSCKKLITHKDKWLATLIHKNTKPELIILATVSYSDVSEAEKHWVKHFKILGNRLTNATEGGEGCPSPSEETRRKIGDNQRGKPKNIKFTPELRKLLSDKAKEWKRSDSLCKKISESKKDVPLSQEHKIAISKAKMKGRIIYCETTGESFNSYAEVVDKYKIHKSSLCEVLKGNRKTVSNLVFKYK